MEQTNKKNPLGDILQEAMGKVREMVDANTIVGQPILSDGVTLIPISKVSFGFGGGGGDYTPKTGTEKNLTAGLGAGVKITPVAFLVVKDGAVRVLPVAVPAATTLDRLVEMVPDAVDKVSAFFSKKADHEAETRDDVVEDF